MLKKNNLAVFAMMVISFLSLLTSGTNAQKAVSDKTEPTQQKCSGEQFVMPLSISVGNEAFSDYIKVASLKSKERRLAFSKQTNEQKANFIKVNLALQFIKRPNMTSDQKAFVLDAISKVSSDLYDKSDAEKVRLSEQSGLEMENRAIGIFTLKDAGDFIEPLMTGKDEEIMLLQNYENLLKNGMKTRKKIAREMPINERVNIWKTQLVYHLATANLSKPQRQFILDFFPFFSPESFEFYLKETKEESAKSLQMLDTKIQTVFSKAESFAIFEAIGIQKIVTDNEAELRSIAPEWCDCRWYCDQGTCSTGTCNSDMKDCGPGGTLNCVYKCR
jgi:hypothetical protein